MRHVAIHALIQRYKIRSTGAAVRAEMLCAVLGDRADNEAGGGAAVRAEGTSDLR